MILSVPDEPDVMALIANVRRIRAHLDRDTAGKHNTKRSYTNWVRACEALATAMLAAKRVPPPSGPTPGPVEPEYRVTAERTSVRTGVLWQDIEWESGGLTFYGSRAVCRPESCADGHKCGALDLGVVDPPS